MSQPIPKSPYNRTKTRRRSSASLDRKLLARFAALTAGEPTVPTDGTCAVCGKPRRPERSARYAHGCAEIDAFCSTECARKFHENPYPERLSTGCPPRVPVCGTWNAYRSGCRCDTCREFENGRKRAERARRKEIAA